MAKDQPHLADLMIDDEKSWLSRLLADEATWDRRTLWRLGSWAAGSVGALVVAILSVHASSEMRREQTAALDLARQARQLQTVARDGAVVNRQLASQIETLNGDRDRLFARITAVEQGLDSITGAVAKQSAPSSLALASAVQSLTTMPPPVVTVPATVVVATDTIPAQEPLAPPLPAAAPAASALPAFPSHTVGPASASAAPQSTAPAPTQTPAEAALAATVPHTSMAPAAKELLLAAKSSAKSDNQADARAESSAEVKADPKSEPRSDPKPEGKSEAATSSSLGPKANMAAGSAHGPAPAVVAATKPPPEVAVMRTDFGVDLGGASSVEGLAALWRGLLKSDGALLSSLRPIMVIRERGNGLGMQLRLVAGPLTDAAAAARICAVLAENDRGCETAVFDGQRLSMKAEIADDPATTSAIPKPGAPKPHVASTRKGRHDEARPRNEAQAAPVASANSFLPGFMRH